MSKSVQLRTAKPSNIKKNFDLATIQKLVANLKPQLRATEDHEKLWGYIRYRLWLDRVETKDTFYPYMSDTLRKFNSTI